MSFNDFGEKDPSQAPGVSEKEQMERLLPMLAKNMQRIVSDREFFEKLKKRFKEIHPGVDLDGGNDISVGVSRTRIGRRLEDDSWQESEDMYVGFTFKGDDYSVTSMVPAAKRIDTPDGPRLQPDDPFTEIEGQLVADMVDELMLAKESGQIPDLHQFDLSRIYIPKPDHERY